MSPDTPQERIGRLEQAMAAFKQQIDDQVRRIEHLDRQYQGLAPLIVAVAEIRIQLERAIGEAEKARIDLHSLEDKLDERDEEQRQERKADRKWMVITVLTAAGLIVAAIGLMVG